MLSAGGAALDAVEVAVRVVEDDPDDHTVGYGGYPNVEGVVELDAAVMDGATRRAGAVGALRGFRHAVSVARTVMERLPHVLLVGDGAARFARELGLPEEDLLTADAERVWRQGLEGALAEGSAEARSLAQLAALATDPEKAAGTVNVVARDRSGHLASAVSTSGWAWKHPGRLGDTPVIGAGSYCDDRWGAVGCTGFGELSIRGATAFRAAAAMGAGAAPEDALVTAVLDLFDLGVPRERVVMHAVALDRHGRHGGVSTREGTTYVVWEDGDAAVRELPRRAVAPA